MPTSGLNLRLEAATIYVNVVLGNRDIDEELGEQRLAKMSAVRDPRRAKQYMVDVSRLRQRQKTQQG